MKAASAGERKRLGHDLAASGLDARFGPAQIARIKHHERAGPFAGDLALGRYAAINMAQLNVGVIVAIIVERLTKDFRVNRFGALHVLGAQLQVIQAIFL